jgi:hypothetical protein
MNRSLSRLGPAAIVVALLVGSAVPALAAPGNDAIENATAIPGIPYTNSQDTSEATTGPTDPDCFGTGPTVWYSFTASEAGLLAASTFGSDYDTTLYLGTPDGAGGIDLIDCNDDSGSLQSAIRFSAEPGVTYLFMVGAYGGGPGGTLVFNLDVAPPPLEMTIAIDRIGTFDGYGGAVVSGTVTCSQPVEVVGVGAGLQQRVGRFLIGGFGETYVESCSPDATPWSTYVTSGQGKFAGGAATLYVFAYTCDGFGCTEAFTEGTVRLRR